MSDTKKPQHGDIGMFETKEGVKVIGVVMEEEKLTEELERKFMEDAMNVDRMFAPGLNYQDHAKRLERKWNEQQTKNTDQIFQDSMTQYLSPQEFKEKSAVRRFDSFLYELANVSGIGPRWITILIDEIEHKTSIDQYIADGRLRVTEKGLCVYAPEKKAPEVREEQVKPVLVRLLCGCGGDMMCGMATTQGHETTYNYTCDKCSDHVQKDEFFPRIEYKKNGGYERYNSNGYRITS